MKKFEEVFLCPHSEYAVKFDEQKEGFVSENGNFYPMIGGIPVLVDDAASYLWRQYLEINSYVDKRLVESNDLEEKIKSEKLIASSLERINRKISGIENELEDIQSLVNESLVEFYNKHYGEASPMTEYEGGNAPNFVFQYFFYVFRDWYWETGENEKAFEVIKKVMPEDLGRCLVLGSGASRLAYDISKNLNNEFTLATDFNYLFLYMAKKIMRGEEFKLTWLPEHPATLENVKNEYMAPKFENSEKLHFAACDFYENTFQDKSFDTIVVPWFLDVMELKLEDMLKKINRWLKPGGKLIYFGPYSFEKFGEINSYLPKEIGEIAQNCGFALGESHLTEIPYLNDPTNTQSRVEKVLSFVAEKSKEAKIKPMRFNKIKSKLPLWLLHHDESIPNSSLMKQRKGVYDVFSFVYKQIDGKITFDKLSKAFAKEYGMSHSQAKTMLEEHFKKIF
ncbi:MAG: class I SAM-dependent methyltransferase [Halobacteriovoraceae bacterium]|nr:class I SAM-dependent methyltransferase [Halobacteriovoraceae bacterium]MCB9095113.1 class I SAM-dependent methyltransferase [Halobacteriovoraceae bacterium]